MRKGEPNLALRRTNDYVLAGDEVWVDVSTLAHPAVVAIIDFCDLSRVCDGQGRWVAIRIPNSKTLYVARKSRSVYLHRHILNYSQRDPRVDHKNGDGLDNRKDNLRPATGSLNIANQGIKLYRSLPKGVSLRKDTGKYSAKIGVNGRTLHLGEFSNKNTAALAYDAAARHYFGEFARTNYD